MKRQLFIILIFTVLTGCNGLHVGVGLKGEIVDEDTIVLEGDTFTIGGVRYAKCPLNWQFAKK